MGERLTRLDLAGEGEEDRTHRVAEPAVGDNHVEDRLALRCHALPNVQRFEQPPRCRDDRGSALVIGVAAAMHRVGHGDAKLRSQCLAQRDGQRKAGEAAAGNQHVDRVVSAIHETQACTDPRFWTTTSEQHSIGRQTCE